MEAIFTDEIAKQLREGKFKYLVADILGDKKIYKFDLDTDEFIGSVPAGSPEGLRVMLDKESSETIKRGTGSEEDEEIKQKVGEYIAALREIRAEAISRGWVDGYGGYSVNDNPRMSEYEKQKELLTSWANLSEFVARKVRGGKFSDMLRETKGAGLR